MITIEQVYGRNLKIYGRDKDGKRYTKIITDFTPYFYNNKKEKIKVTTPSDVPHRRRAFPFTYEADIPYAQRYLIDRCDIPLPNEPLRICYLDIEVTNACLDSMNATEPIISITCYDNFLKRYVTFVWRKDVERKVEKRDDWSIYYYNTEEDMMQMFINFVSDTDPDILTGWAVDRYDFPYIINRCKKHLRININKISPLGYVDCKEREWKGRKIFSLSIKGRTILDLLKAYKKLNLSGLPSYSLEYISKLELGEDKGKPYLRDLWKNIDTLIEYNKHDVMLTVKIDEKRMCIDFFNNARKLTGSLWRNVFWFSQLNDILLLRKAKERGMLLPTKPEGNVAEKFGGGFVLDSIPGLHKGVFVLDLKSLYPSIIQQFNMCYFTVDKPGYELGNGISFAKEPKGLIPGMIQFLIDERDKVKKKMKQYEYGTPKYKAYYSYQFAMKFIINAVYGATGYPRFRLFNPKVAASITWIGRELAKWNKELIEKSNPNWKVIYSDTDSVFVETGKEDLNVTLLQMENCEKILNESYEKFVKQYGCEKNTFIKIRAEEVFKTIFFGIKASGEGAKKRYAGKLTWLDVPLKEPRMKIVGFETERSDHNVYGKKILEKVFNMVLDEASRKEVEDYLFKMQEGMKNAPIDDIAIPQTLKKNTEQYDKKGPHVRGSEYANQYLEENIYAGDKIKMLYVKEVSGKAPTNVICYTRMCPSGVVVDWEKMTMRTINNKTDRIFEALRWVDEPESLTNWMVKT